MLKKCNCKHESQDKLYGKGIRVHNHAAKVGIKGAWRCTVCGKEKARGSEASHGFSKAKNEKEIPA